MKNILFSILAMFLITFVASAQKYESQNYTTAMEKYYQYDYQNAALYLSKHLEEFPNDNVALLIRALSYNTLQEYSKALNDVNNAIQKTSKRDKELYLYYKTRAEIYFNIDLYNEAELDLKKALKLSANDNDVLTYLISLYILMDRYDETETYAKKMLSKDILSPFAYYALGVVYINKEDYQTALENFDKSIKYDPSFIFSYHSKADLLSYQEKYKEALDVLVDGLNIDNTNSDLESELDYLIYHAPKDVIRKMNQIIIDNKGSYFWYLIRARAYAQINEYEKALADYLKTEEILGLDNANIYEYASSVCISMGNYHKALEYINKAIQVSIEQDIIEDNAYMYCGKADINLKLSNYSDAIEACDKAIELHPSYSYAYTVRGLIYYTQDLMEEAITNFNEALLIDEENSRAYLYRGRALEALGRKDEAKIDYETIVKLDTSISSFSYKGFALFHLGKTQEAITFYNEVLKKDSIGGAYNAACFYALVNDTSNALKYLGLALKTGEQQDFYHIQWDDDLDNIRETTDFKALIEQYDNRHKFNTETTNDTEFVEKTTTIKMAKVNGVFEIPCEINGLRLKMLFDSGASYVTISSLESSFMLKNDYLKAKDIFGSSNFLDASGNINEGTVIILSEVKLGDFTLKNVRATVVKNQNAPLLLGQTVLKRFANISIDNEKQELKIIYKEKQ